MPSFRTRIVVDSQEIVHFHEAPTPEDAVALLFDYLQLEWLVDPATQVRIKHV